MVRHAMLSLSLLAGLAAGSPALAGEGSGYGAATPAAAAAAPDVVEVARSAGSFDTLVRAIQAAGLVDTLKGDGPFTVFAPTDAAFAKVPPAQLEALLADPVKLKQVLTYHVVAGKVTAADVAKLQRAKTVEGGELRIDTSNGVQVNDARVTKADVPASNGVIHVIDTVLLPQS